MSSGKPAIFRASVTSAPHRVDIAEGVGGGDGAVGVGVIHQRREKIHRQHHGLLIVELVDRGVVGRGQADEEIGVLADLPI